MKNNSKNSKLLSRTKKIAATVAALGAAIGVNMSDVLAGSADLPVRELGKAEISSHKIKKSDVRSMKMEEQLKRRPPAVGAKIEAPGLKNRPNVRAHKVEIKPQNGPGATNR